ncbi:MAG: HEPN domain-containing protein [Ferruginibacter sp.]|nr:HEPN domain-containing protein [Ferruginibacter sp.]
MKEFEKWFKKAEGDFIIISSVILLDDAPYDLCCFHSQQGSEKYLKAYLISVNKDFPKIHDLFKLLQICITKNESFREIEMACKRLNDFAVTPRYPDDFDELTLKDAQNAYADAKAIKTFVITHFF